MLIQKNPINLAINAPTGKGKTYILQKVMDKFPQQDVLMLYRMSDKSLFHRPGKLVVKNEKGEYESIDERLAEIDSEIQDKQSDKQHKSDIKDLEDEKKQLLKDARKLIDLSHKILVFLDPPSPELFGAIMSLLSHDKYEVEYEFVDAHNGIKTKNNVLRGWPAVIFAQAID